MELDLPEINVTPEQMEALNEEWLKERDNAKENIRKAQRKEEERLVNEAAEKEPIWTSIQALRDYILTLMPKGTTWKKTNESTYHKLGIELCSKVGEGRVEVAIRKRYPLKGSYRFPKDEDTSKPPIGIWVRLFGNDGSFGKEHEFKHAYKVELDKPWDDKKFKRILDEKVAKFQRVIAERKATVDAITKGIEDKAILKIELEKQFGLELIPLSRKIKDYSKKYGTGRNAWYPEIEDPSVKEFKATVNAEFKMTTDAPIRLGDAVFCMKEGKIVEEGIVTSYDEQSKYRVLPKGGSYSYDYLPESLIKKTVKTVPITVIFRLDNTGTVTEKFEIFVNSLLSVNELAKIFEGLKKLGDVE